MMIMAVFLECPNYFSMRNMNFKIMMDMSILNTKNRKKTLPTRPLSLRNATSSKRERGKVQKKKKKKKIVQNC